MILKIIFKINFASLYDRGGWRRPLRLGEVVENVCFPGAHCPSQRSCTPLRRGSRASRRASPRRLKPNIAMLTARLGEENEPRKDAAGPH